MPKSSGSGSFTYFIFSSCWIAVGEWRGRVQDEAWHGARSGRLRFARRRSAPAAVALGEGARELRAAKKDLRGIIDPEQHDDERPGRAVRRRKGAATKVKSQQEFPQDEEGGGDGGPDPHVAPGDFHV